MSSAQELQSDAPAPESEKVEAAEASSDALFLCIDRIETMIEAENALLRKCAPFDMERSNLRKARALIELARASQTFPMEVSPRAAERLQSFQAKLKENTELLERHLRATIEIAELLVTAIRREQSDGTYSNKAAVASK
jgi:hypothetical protein